MLAARPTTSRRFRCLTCVAVLVLAATNCTPRPRSRDTGLERYVGVELRGAIVKSLWQDVEELTGKARGSIAWAGFGGTLAPWWVRPFRAGSGAWILLEAYTGIGARECTGARVHVFDDNWNLIRKTAFPTGYRLLIADIDVVRDKRLDHDLLCVSTYAMQGVGGFDEEGAPPPEPWYHQYYTLRRDEFVSVRLEDVRGRAIHFTYRHESPEWGPPPPNRTPEEWIAALECQRPIDQLETLVWLTGDHLPSVEPRLDGHSQESIENARCLEAVRRSARTKAALAKLVGSPHPWIQEYAHKAQELARGG